MDNIGKILYWFILGNKIKEENSKKKIIDCLIIRCSWLYSFNWAYSPWFKAQKYYF